MPAEFAIVADDLTGAADSGVQFARNGYRTAIFFRGESPTTNDLDVAVLDTDSRAESEDEARRRVTEAGESISDSNIVFKKIDSTLRGNLAVEIESLMRTTERRCAVVAPAFPSGGRTTIDGVQFVDGVPVHETEFGRDPKTPVIQSDLTSILSSVAPITLLGTDDLTDENKVRAAVSDGGVIVADATDGSHLSFLVATVSEPSEVLWVGTAGLAGALAEAYPGSRTQKQPGLSAERVLAVIGSLSDVSREQLRVAVERGYATAVELGGTEVIQRIRQALSDGGDVILHSPESGGDLSSVEITEVISKAVSDLEGSFDALFLTGGDTAVGVARRLGATGMEVYGEVEAGVPFGALIGAVDYPVVTKAGGFGDPETLCRAIGFLRGEVG